MRQIDNSLGLSMYTVGLIDISQWNRAGWKGTVYGWAPPGVDDPPCLGLLFSNPDAAKDIFGRWRKFLGKSDIREVIQVSIIEGEIEGKLPGYSVYIGPNPEIVKSVGMTGKQDTERHVMLTARIHRMTPKQDSKNLEQFKIHYFKHGQFLFLPAWGEEIEPQLGYELAIVKRNIRFIRVNELTENDPEIVVLKKEGWSGKDRKVIKGVESIANSITPERLTEGVKILKKELGEGRIEKRIDPMILDSLDCVKYDSEGLVILETLNPLLAIEAEEAAQKVYEREASKIPLDGIQKGYVDFLNYYFGDAHSQMISNNLTPEEMAKAMSKDDEYIKKWKLLAPKMLEFLREKWYVSGSVTAAHLRKMNTLKAIYGGNVFPNPDSNLVANVGLYIDTLILPDPILSCLSLHDILKPRNFVFRLAKNALTAIEYSGIAIADLEVPLVVFTPNYFFLSESLPRLIATMSEEDLCIHLGKVFNYSFSSFKDIQQYFKAAGSPEAIAASVVDKDKFLLDAEENPLPLDQMELIREDLQEFEETRISDDALRGVLTSFHGRFMQINSVIAHSDMYGGIPLIDAPTSWQYYLWKLEYGNAEATRDAAISHVLHSDLERMPLLKNISVDAVIELRKRKLLPELRKIFREGVVEISGAGADSIRETEERVASNIKIALREYEKLVEDIPKQIGKMAVQSVSIAGGLSLGIAATASGYMPLMYAAIAAGYLGLPSAKDVIKSARSIWTKHQAIRKSPVGILCRVLH